MANILYKARKNATLESTMRVDMRHNKLALGTLCDALGEVHLETSTKAVLIAFSSPCRFGGVRWWYKCKTCNKGRMILYYIKSSNHFVCRNCTNAVHSSSQAGKGDRAISTRWKILRKYGLSNRGLDGFHRLNMHDKPKGMHRKTWANVCERYNLTYLREPAFAQLYYAAMNEQSEFYSNALKARRQYLRLQNRAAYMRDYRARKKQERISKLL